MDLVERNIGFFGCFARNRVDHNLTTFKARTIVLDEHNEMKS